MTITENIVESLRESSDDQSPADDAKSAMDDRELVVVSNRQPYRHAGDDQLSVSHPTGGLTAGLDPVMKQTGGTWIAWGDGDGDEQAVDEDDCVSVPPESPSYTLKRIWLSDEQVRDYYYGFSNQVLWPICHSTLANVRSEPAFWQQYRRTNEQFATAIAEHDAHRPLVWLQDYHLALVPRLARQELSDDAVLMHFWHIPWPSWETFRACPYGREILDGLLGNDVLGFHVPRYRRQFLRCVDATFDGATVDFRSGTVSYQDSVTQVESIPMGVPAQKIEDAVTDPSIGDCWTSLRQRYDISDETRIGVGVDRLDYTKGIPQRLRALEHLWETEPDRRGTFTYVQVGSESRSQIPAYQEVQDRVAESVERINDRFGTDDWQPVVYTTDHLTQTDLYALYRHADVGIVTPIRDGMNLVAQEYVAAQVDGDGALVLSDQAGFHDMVGEYTFSVNPHETRRFAETIAEALDASIRERRGRMGHLRHHVFECDLDAWLRASLELITPNRVEQDRGIPRDGS